MKRASLILPLLLASIPSARALADTDTERSPWDLSVKLGVTAGQLSKGQTVTQNADGTSTTTRGALIDYGGFPIALSYNQDLTRKLTMNVEVHMVADHVNAQISETGIAVGLAIHVLGGSRRTVKEYPYATIVQRDPYNVSLLARFAYSHYGLSSQTGSQVFDGSAFEPFLGAQYRVDISERGALAFELYTTVDSLPASDSRVFSSRWEFAVSYRFFL